MKTFHLAINDLETFIDRDIDLLAMYYNISKNYPRYEKINRIARHIYNGASMPNGKYKNTTELKTAISTGEITCNEGLEILKEFIDGKKFFNRAKGSIIENEYDILFNLFLVKNDVRPAFLLETANFPNIDPEELFNIVKTIYNEFDYTIENEIDGIVHRVFFHVNPLTSSLDKYHDVWVAENLGFLCQGIASERTSRKAINYTFVTDDINADIYAEICSDSDFNKKYFEEKEKLFNSYANMAGGIVTMTITNLISRTHYLDLLLSNKLTKSYKHDLLEFLTGYGYGAIESNINSGSYSFEDLIKDKKLLLFTLARTFIEPLSLYFPLPNKLSEQLENIETDIFNTLDTDPVELHKKLVNTPIYQKILNRDLSSKNTASMMTIDLYDAYQKLIDPTVTSTEGLEYF